MKLRFVALAALAAITCEPAASRPMLTSVDIALRATVTSVTGGGTFFYDGPPNEDGETESVRRDFTVQQIPGFFYQVGDTLNVRWNIDGAALNEAYGPDYQETGETFFSSPIALCGKDISFWTDSDCDTRVGLRADELTYDGRRLFTSSEMHDVAESPEAQGPLVDLISFEIDPAYVVSVFSPRDCCRYFFDDGTDSFFTTEEFVPVVDYGASSFARGSIGPDGGIFTLRFPILRPGLVGRELFDNPFGVFEANINFDADWIIETTSVPEPSQAALLVFGLMAAAGMRRRPFGKLLLGSIHALRVRTQIAGAG